MTKNLRTFWFKVQNTETIRKSVDKREDRHRTLPNFNNLLIQNSTRIDKYERNQDKVSSTDGHNNETDKYKSPMLLEGPKITSNDRIWKQQIINQMKSSEQGYRKPIFCRSRPIFSL